MAELERALALVRRGDMGGARTKPFRFGTAVFNDELPRRFDSNYLLVEQFPPDAATADLVTDADRILGGAGLPHRKLAVLDERLGARLEPDLRGIGWEAQRLLLMVHGRPPERPVDTSLVHEVDETALRPLRARALSAYPWAQDPEVVDQLVAAKRFVAAAVTARFFAVRVDGEVVAATDLYASDGAAQIEDLVTLPEHRGRGYASALVVKALEEARLTGNDLVFLLADDEDWPKALYARLGFEPLARTYGFLKRPT